MQEKCRSTNSNDDDRAAYYRLSADIWRGALLANGVLALLLAVTDGLFGNHSEESLLWLLVGCFLTLPFLLIALIPLAIRRYSANPELKREKLKAMNAFTALMILLWAPGIVETIDRIKNPIAGDGGAWGFAALFVIILMPLIVVCTRLEESVFTRISVRLFGVNDSNQPKMVATLAVMFVCNLLQAATVIYGVTALFMFGVLPTGR